MVIDLALTKRIFGLADVSKFGNDGRHRAWIQDNAAARSFPVSGGLEPHNDAGGFSFSPKWMFQYHVHGS